MIPGLAQTRVHHGDAALGDTTGQRLLRGEVGGGSLGEQMKTLGPRYGAEPE